MGEKPFTHYDAFVRDSKEPVLSNVAPLMMLCFQLLFLLLTFFFPGVVIQLRTVHQFLRAIPALPLRRSCANA